MYGYIKGKIEEQKNNYIVVEVNNIGYKINVANPYNFELDKEYKIYLYNHIREDEFTLFGFKDENELELFEKLINVKGLGPRSAIVFFATGSTSGIIDAINRENLLYLTKFPKIGEKLAKQIILDLKGKVSSEGTLEEENTFDDLISVLESLGYKANEIKKILKDIDINKKVEQQVKDALKLLMR